MKSLVSKIREKSGYIHFPTVDRGVDVEGSFLYLAGVDGFDAFNIGDGLIEILTRFGSVQGSVTVRKEVADVLILAVEKAINKKSQNEG